MTKQEVIIIIFVLILIVGNVFFGGQYFNAEKQLKIAQKSLSNQKANEKVINFSKLFVDEVLRSENEISFEVRLKLENAVRNTNDKNIVAAWQKFIESKTEIEAQNNVKDLLEILISSIQVK